MLTCVKLRVETNLSSRQNIVEFDCSNVSETASQNLTEFYSQSNAPEGKLRLLLMIYADRNLEEQKVTSGHCNTECEID